MTRVVHVANLVHPSSGGIRTVLSRLCDAMARDGHDVRAVVAGEPATPPSLGAARVRAVGGVPLPGTGYRLAVRRDPVVAALESADPEVVLLSDRWTLGWVGAWAAARGVPTVLLAHERLDRTVGSALRLPTPIAGATAALLDASVTATAAVAPSRYVAEEVGRVAPTTVLPWAVDRAVFHPDAGDRPPGRPPHDRSLRLVWCGRFSTEKRPGLAVDVLAHLLGRGVAATCTMIGDGPLRRRVAARSAGLPLRVLGRLDAPAAVATELASADVLLSTCDHEAFGLAASEAMACGTPVAAVSGGGVAQRIAGTTLGDVTAGVVAAPGSGVAGLAAAALTAGTGPWRRPAAARAEVGHDWTSVGTALLELAGTGVTAGRVR